MDTISTLIVGMVLWNLASLSVIAYVLNRETHKDMERERNKRDF